MKATFEYSVRMTIDVKIPRGMTCREFLKSDEFMETYDGAAQLIAKEVLDDVESDIVEDHVMMSRPIIRKKAK